MNAPVRSSRPGGMAREMGRKAIHVSSVAVPVLVWLLPHSVSLAVLLPGALLALAIDYARLTFRPPRYWLHRYFRTLLRPHERRSLVGATWMAVAYAAAVLLFPKPVAVAAMLFNGLGDAAAALVGKRWGRRRVRWGKSWEGFAAGLIVNLGVAATVSMLAPSLWLPAALAGALAAAVAEFLDLPIDDNLRVTMTGGAVIVLVMAGFGR